MWDLASWLNWIKSLSTVGIDLNLDRVKQVGDRLDVLKSHHFVITVAGTNGKGSTVTTLETIFCKAGYSVAAFTSPYLFEFNEQIRINGRSITTEALLEAFEAVAAARRDVALTPFEFTTLAALATFKMLPKGVLILEVGLGGRLDAVNCVEPNLSIVTSVALDHMDFLGETREEIAFEKAGIFRARVPAISGDFVTPTRLRAQATILNTPLYCQKDDFDFQSNGKSWDWWSNSEKILKLPMPKLALQNMSTVLMALQLLQASFPVSRQIIDEVLSKISMPGRLQVVRGERVQVFDVAHNPAAIKLLNDFLMHHFPDNSRYAVFSMLRDKDIRNSILPMQSDITHWFVAPLGVERGASLEMLQQVFRDSGIKNVTFFKNLRDAHQRAKKTSKLDDILVIFGSFYTVAQLL